MVYYSIVINEQHELVCVCFGEQLLTALTSIVLSSSQLCNCSYLNPTTSPPKMITFNATCSDTMKLKPAPEKFRHHGLITVYLNEVSCAAV